MNILQILEKYEKYQIHITLYSRKLIITKKIPVSEFIKFKMELKAINYKYSDIEVRNED